MGNKFNEYNLKFNFYLNIFNSEILKSDVVLYCVKEPLSAHAFGKKENAIEYLSKKKPSYHEEYLIEYLGDFDDKKDVIRETKIGSKSRLISLIDRNRYYVYNNENKKWDIYVGNTERIIPIYDELNENYVSIKNDLYKEKVRVMA